MISFKVGDIVHDDLTGKEAVVLEVLEKEGTPKGYRLDSSWLEGYRLNWEVSVRFPVGVRIREEE